MALRNRRKEILDRLAVVAATVPGIVSVYRNSSTSIPDSSRPAINISDGNENADDGDQRANLTKTGVYIMTMDPDITIFVGANVTAPPSDVLEGLRIALIAAVAGDATLKAITGPNGNIRFSGCSTTDNFGARVEQEMSVMFEFKYPLIAGETA